MTQPIAINNQNANPVSFSEKVTKISAVGVPAQPVLQLTERVFPRLQMRAEYQVCLGFDQIFSVLSSMDDGWCDETVTSASESHTMDSLTGDALLFSSYEEVMAGMEGQASDISSVDVIDSSAGGFCLELDADSLGYPSVGQVLAVRENKLSQWKVCVIRWARPSAEGVQVGVELIAPSAYKTLLRDPYTQAVISPAIYIPGVELVGVPESVVIPTRRNLSNGDKVLVRNFGDDKPHLLDKTGLLTGSVKRMFLSSADTDSVHERTDVAAADIWATF